MALVTLILLGAGFACASGGFQPDVSAYDVTWNDPAYPGAEFGTASMPLGNGDAAANVWWHEGALFALLAKGDAWTEWHDLFKIGRLRLSLDPPPAEANFSFTMHVATGMVELQTEGMSAKLWMDMEVNALRVELTSVQPTTLTVELQRWRNQTRPWTDAEQGYSFYCDWHNRTTMSPDVIVPPSEGAEVIWYHRNVNSTWRADLTHQGLGHALNMSADPFINRTFGGLVEGSSASHNIDLARPLWRVLDDQHARLVSVEPATLHTVSAFVLTDQTPTADDWVGAIRSLAKAGARTTTAAWEQAWAAHKHSWERFWNISRLDMKASNSSDPHKSAAVVVGSPIAWWPKRGTSGTTLAPNQKWTWIGPHESGVIKSEANVSLCLTAAQAGQGQNSAEEPVTVAVCDPSDLSQQWRYFSSGNRTILSIGAGLNCNFGPEGHGCCLSVRGGSATPGTRADLYGCAQPSPPFKNQQFTLTAESVVNDIAGFVLSGGAPPPPSAANVFELARRWHLQRMIHGMLGRGKYPIKFNGNLFTIGQPENIWNGPDFRAYGGFYWHQNTRMSYWSMLGSGDFALMDSFFSFYIRGLPLARERVKTYWGHGGSVFPETLSLFGLFPSGQVGYGCDKRFGADWPAGTGGYKPAWYIKCAYLRYHYNSAIEVTAAMLEYYYYTKSTEFAKSTLLPFAHEVVLFYYSHYQDWHGIWVISPGQSLETWQEAINPSEQIAGIRSVLAGLMAMPAEIVAKNDPMRQLWNEVEAVMPLLPMDDDSCTAGPARDQDAAKAEVADPPALAHAEYWSRHNNIENPELYAIFPYKLFTLASNASKVLVGKTSYSKRVSHGDTSEWQDCIQAALLGMVDEAAELTLGRLDRGAAQMRFPGFYGVMSDANWVPDEGHASILKLTLQYMLVQSDSNSGKIYLFGAWPKGWDANFVLHTEGATVIEVCCEAGVLKKLTVTPQSRRKDLVFVQDYCRPSHP